MSKSDFLPSVEELLTLLNNSEKTNPQDLITRYKEKCDQLPHLGKYQKFMLALIADDLGITWGKPTRY